MSHAFASYVREDEFVVQYIVDVLRKNGVKVWIDKDDIAPGVRWKDAIATAIREGKFFLAMFSRNWQERERTVANEELLIAIEELRQRPRNRAWFIPLRIDECEIPAMPIGPGETLRDIQHIDFPSLGWRNALTRLLQAMGVESPDLEVGEPLGSGLPPTVDLVGGELIVESARPPLPSLHGVVFPVSGGWCTRTSDGVLAYIKTRAPNTNLQEINVQLGLDSFHARSVDGHISNDPARPNTFEFHRSYVLPAGTQLFDMGTGTRTTLPTDMPVELRFTAQGIIATTRFKGRFDARFVLQFGAMKITIDVDGSFDIAVQPAIGPAPAR